MYFIFQSFKYRLISFFILSILSSCYIFYVAAGIAAEKEGHRFKQYKD